jgi:hypothetical protein
MLLDTHAEGIERAPRTLRASWRTCIEGGPTARLAFAVLGGALGAVAVALFWMTLMFALSLIGDQMHRKGDFSGAGAEVVWARGP